MKRKIALLIALLAASALMLTACGGDKKTEDATATTVSATQSTAKDAGSKAAVSSKSDSSSKADESADGKTKTESSSAVSNGGSGGNGGSGDNDSVNAPQDGGQSAESKSGGEQQPEKPKSGSDSSKSAQTSLGESSDIDITLDEYELPIIFE